MQYVLRKLTCDWFFVFVFLYLHYQYFPCEYISFSTYVLQKLNCDPLQLIFKLSLFFLCTVPVPVGVGGGAVGGVIGGAAVGGGAIGGAIGGGVGKIYRFVSKIKIMIWGAIHKES